VYMKAFVMPPNLSPSQIFTRLLHLMIQHNVDDFMSVNSSISLFLLFYHLFLYVQPHY